MTTPVQYKVYKTIDNGKPSFSISPGFNTPFGFQESSVEEFNQLASPDQKNNPGIMGMLSKVSSGQTAGVNDAGVFRPAGALERIAEEKAKVASGEYARIGGTDSAPLYAPSGSPADLQQRGITPTVENVTPDFKALVEANKPKVGEVSMSASGVSTSTGPTLPQPQAGNVTTAYTNSLTADLENKRKTLESTYQKQIDDLKAKSAEAQKRMDDFTSKQEDVLGNVEELSAPFRAELEKTERERLFVEKNFFDNQKLVDELQSLLTESNELIKQQQAVTGLSVIRDPRVAKTISDAAARAGILEATLSARNGQIAQAYTLIDRSVAATTADRQDQLNYYSTLFNFYQNQKDAEGNKLVELSKTERVFLNAQIGLLENDLSQAQASANKIKDLITSPESAKFVADAGITLNDSVQTINQKMAAQTVKVQKEAEYKENKEMILASGITSQFVNKNGEIQRSADGFSFSSPEQFQQMTGLSLQQAQNAGMITTLSVKPDLKGTPTSYQEYLLAKQEGYKGSYNDYQTMDANRKAVRSTTNIYAGDQQVAKEEARVKQIISAHPNEWGQAADQIDKEFGIGTATKYDALLRDAYAKSDLDPTVKAFLGL